MLCRYKKLSKSVRAAFWFTICNFLQKGISFVCLPLYTRLLPLEEYGLMSVMNSYQSIFIILATFELSLGAYQRGILKYKTNISLYTQSIILLSNIITFFFLLIVCLLHNYIFKISGLTFGLIILMCIYFFFYTPYNCWLNLKRFEYDYKPAVLVSLFFSFGSGFFPIFALYCCSRTAKVEVGATLIFGIMVFIPFWIKYFHFNDIICNIKNIKQYIVFALKFQIPLVFHSLSFYILSQSDRLMIKAFNSTSNVAFYSVAYSLAYVIIIFQNSLNQVLKPWRYQKLEEKRYDEIKRQSNMLMVAVGVVVTIFALIIPEVFKLLFDDKYYEAISVMPPVTLSVFFVFLYTISVDIESYYGHTKLIGYITSTSAVINIILNYVFLKVFDYYICAYTTLLCYIIMSTLHAFSLRKLCREEKVENEPIDIKFMRKISIGLIALFMLIIWNYNNLIVRYIVLIIILILIVLKRHSITKAWQWLNQKE